MLVLRSASSYAVKNATSLEEQWKAVDEKPSDLYGRTLGA
jgi:hypothetical protein